MARNLLIATAVVLLVGAIFVAIRIISQSRGPRYAICIANRTQHDLDDVGVFYGNRVAAIAGSLVKGGYASYAIVTLPVPDYATITWTVKKDGVRKEWKPAWIDHWEAPEVRLNAPGEHHARKVTLNGIARDEDIWFVIEEDGSVVVEMIGRKDMSASLRVLKSLPQPEKK